MTAGEVVVGYRKKIIKYDKGIFALAGRETCIPKIKKFLEIGKKFDAEKGDLDCIFTKNGKVYYMNYLLIPEVCYVPWALGVHDRQLEALMKYGVSAAEAVAEACKYGLGCGGEIDVYVV